MSWNVQQQTDEGARRRTRYTGRGGLVSGLWPCWDCGSARPKEDEGRETGSLRGTHDWGLLPAWREQDEGDPCPGSGGAISRVLPSSEQYVEPLCMCQGWLQALAAQKPDTLPTPGPMAASCLPQHCPITWGGSSGNISSQGAGTPASCCQCAIGSSSANAWSRACAARCLHAVHG